MRIQSKRHILPLIIPIVVIVFVAYVLWAVVSSGILPLKYTVALVVGSLIWVSVSVWLLSHRFATLRRRAVARTFAAVMMIILILGSTLGVYVLQRSLAMLDGLSGANSVTIKTDRSFNIFISGIDTYGDISTQSRSDVNIVATVNPDTRQILLTTIPRDAYVSIALGGNDGMDKLTHAGIYGVDSSMKTVARLLGTEIDAYVRINFTSFIESIDALGDITVHNESAFTLEGEYFPPGQLTLNGKRALLFSRERKSLNEGDVDRGKNQQKVIQAIVDKMSQVRSIGGFEALLGMIGSSVQTNISSETLKGLINQQINRPSAWTTKSYTLTGKGQIGGLPSHAMPSAQLYMYVLDESSVEEASRQIAEFSTGSS